MDEIGCYSQGEEGTQDLVVKRNVTRITDTATAACSRIASPHRNDKNLGNEKIPAAVRAYFLTCISHQGQRLF